MASLDYDYGEAIRSFTCDELKKLLIVADLPRSGLKNDLQRRCLEYLNFARDPNFLREITNLHEARTSSKRTGVRRTSSVVSIDKCMARMSIARTPSYNQLLAAEPVVESVSVVSRKKAAETCCQSSQTDNDHTITKVSVQTQTDLARQAIVDMSTNKSGKISSSSSSLQSPISLTDIMGYQFEKLPFYENKRELARSFVSPPIRGSTTTCVLTYHDSSIIRLLHSSLGIQARLAIVYRSGKFIETLKTRRLFELRVNGHCNQFNDIIRGKAYNVPDVRSHMSCRVEFTFGSGDDDGELIGYVAALILCSNPPVPIREISLPILISSLDRLSVDESKRRIVEKFKPSSLSSDVNVDPNSKIKISLLCPLTGTRCLLPVRGFNCSHLQVFNAADYIKLNQVKPKWTCPICSTEAHYDSLVVDTYIQEILTKTTSNEIELLSNGGWEPVLTNRTRLVLETIPDSPVQVDRDVLGRRIPISID